MFCILTVVKQIYMYIKVHGIIYSFFLLNRYFLRNCAEIKFLPCQLTENVKVDTTLVARLEK